MFSVRNTLSALHINRTKTLAITGAIAVTGAFMASGVAVAHASTTGEGKAGQNTTQSATADAAVANLMTQRGGNLVDSTNRSVERAALPNPADVTVPAAPAPAAPAPAAPAPAPAAPATPTYTNNLDGWIKEARDVLAANGTQVSYNAIYQAAMNESGGNPTVVNGWDINAKNGIPSIGLLQVIQPTFNAHKLPGHDNIKNPVDNIIAGVRYAEDRYGSMEKVVADRCGGTCWRGY